MMLTIKETRLIAVLRAISKFGNPTILDETEASLVHAYVENLIDMDHLEQEASSENIEYFLDGVILGLAANRLLTANVAPDETPKAKVDEAKQFQTGVDPISGDVNVNEV